MAILAVRSFYCTCRINIKKYYDVETQKWIRDKLEKIKSFTLADVMDGLAKNFWSVDQSRKIDNYTKYYEYKWFIPKDNDWED